MMDEAHKVIEYMTECTLATIERMAMRKHPLKGELERQINIACRGLGILRPLSGETKLRVREILNIIPSITARESVERWVAYVHACQHSESDSK